MKPIGDALELQRIAMFILTVQDIINREPKDQQDIIMKHRTYAYIYREAFVPSGSIYVCFTCGSIIERNKMVKKRWFQLTGVWHECLNREHGIENEYYLQDGTMIAVPTVGITTRPKVLKRAIENISEMLPKK